MEITKRASVILTFGIVMSLMGCSSGDRVGEAPPSDTTYAQYTTVEVTEPPPPTVALGESVKLDDGSTLTIDSVEKLTKPEFQAILDESDAGTVTAEGPFALITATYTNNSDDYKTAPDLDYRTDQTTASGIFAYGGPDGNSDLITYEVAPDATFTGYVTYYQIPGEPDSIVVGEEQAIVEL